MAKFFKIPFASGGTKTAIPNAADAGGAISYQEGYPIDYERDQSSDPLAKDIERDKFNQVIYDVTDAIKSLQVHGYPDFISTGDNDGAPYSYDINSYVRYNGVVYESLVDTNTALPTDATKWRAVNHQNPIPTGTIWEYEGSTLPDAGWIWPDGRTIGNAASGATNRANVDAYNLFALTWTSYPNAIRPIQNSDGTPGARGISALADWNANKRLPIRDRRGRAGVGRDNMGGTAANRLTYANSGIDGTVLGAFGGLETHTLISDEVPQTAVILPIGSEAALDGDNPAGALNRPVVDGFNYLTTSNVPMGVVQGGGLPHSNVQPSDVINFILKL